MMPNNYSQWERHEAEQEARLRKRPVCSCCGEPIQEDSVVQIRRDYYCDDCLDDMRVYIED